MKIGVIGGSGIYKIAGVDTTEISVSTEYGEVTVYAAIVGDREVFFLARHGKGHSVPPHRVNYRGNIMALKTLGVERVIATNAVGSLNPEIGPGTVVLVDQFLDFTKSRPVTFFEGPEVVHTDMTYPYCPQMIDVAYSLRAPFPIRKGGVMVVTEGPRFESAAEVKAFRLLGGDVVGMTSVPEVVLAREAGMCYMSLAIVSNFAAGLQGAVTHDEVLEIMDKLNRDVQMFLLELIRAIPSEKTCPCPRDSKPIGR
ncbi:MTAP family purine nucleoside phosphorylase [Coprothermobacteraceae bacterium]|nr:MTAP family purine nucleoside phosphorylase [Coprothermobacteraceae bacterium]